LSSSFIKGLLYHAEGAVPLALRLVVPVDQPKMVLVRAATNHRRPRSIRGGQRHRLVVVHEVRPVVATRDQGVLDRARTYQVGGQTHAVLKGAVVSVERHDAAVPGQAQLVMHHSQVVGRDVGADGARPQDHIDMFWLDSSLRQRVLAGFNHDVDDALWCGQHAPELQAVEKVSAGRGVLFDPVEYRRIVATDERWHGVPMAEDRDVFFLLHG